MDPPRGAPRHDSGRFPFVVARARDRLDLVHAHRVEQVPVVRDGRPVGIVVRHDLLELMLDQVTPVTR